jgi:hypothetical protein
MRVRNGNYSEEYIGMLDRRHQERVKRRNEMREAYRSSNDPAHKIALAAAERAYGIRDVIIFSGVSEQIAALLVLGEVRRG